MQFSYTLLAAIFAIFGVAQAGDCNIICPRNYAPVCGSDGTHLKVFNNKCMMEYEGCKSATKWQETLMDSCVQQTVTPRKNCNTICPTIYNPVCATNGGRHEIFANSCNLEARNCQDNNQWRLTKLNVCEAPEEHVECMVICEFTFDPVCAFDGKKYHTFVNECVYNKENCYVFRKWSIVQKGACPEAWTF